MNPPLTFIPNLTPMRGIAAVWVMFFHYQVVIVRVLQDGWEGLFEKAYLWVDFFFVLSGFIIYHVYSSSFQQGINKKSFGKFFLARFARIYPLHFFLLLILVLIQCLLLLSQPEIAFQGFSSVDKLITSFLLLHSMGIHDSLSWNVPSWSISAEWWVYMVAPFLFLLFKKSRPWLFISIYVLCMLGLYALPFFSSHTDNLDVTFDLGVVRCLFGFTSGVVVYQWYRTGWGKRFFSQDLSFLLGIAWVIAYFIWEGDQAGGIDVLVIPAFGLLVLACAHNTGRLSKLFSTRFLMLTGDISYSLYLVQGLTIGLTMGIFLFPNNLQPGTSDVEPLWGWLGVIGFILVNYLIAWITYRTIEVPMRKKIKTWGSK